MIARLQTLCERPIFEYLAHNQLTDQQDKNRQYLLHEKMYLRNRRQKRRNSAPLENETQYTQKHYPDKCFLRARSSHVLCDGGFRDTCRFVQGLIKLAFVGSPPPPRVDHLGLRRLRRGQGLRPDGGHRRRGGPGRRRQCDGRQGAERHSHCGRPKGPRWPRPGRAESVHGE